MSAADTEVPAALLDAEARLRSPLDIPPAPQWLDRGAGGRPLRVQAWPEWQACEPHFAPLRFSCGDDGSLEAADPDEADWMPFTATAQATLMWRWHQEAAARIYEDSRGPHDWLTPADLPGAQAVAVIETDGPGQERQVSAEASAPDALGADLSSSPPPPGPSKSGTIPPPVEEVMPDGPASTAALENVPLPGQDAERDTGRSITGQGHPEPDDDEADRIQHAAEDSLRRAGVKDEDIADLHRPHEQTAEMTAVLPVPQESERQ